MRIACVDNLSAYAFRRGEELPGAITFVSPAESFRLAAGGLVDAALLPTAALPLLPHLQPLPFGIACEGAVTSVVLCSQKPVGELVREKSACYVSPASVTSRALLTQLCHRAYGASPIISEDSAAQARILMGDDAADADRTEYKWPYVIDLGQWWFQLTQLPFVYAQWAVRSGLGAAGKASIENWLEACALRSETPEGIALMVKRATAKGFLGASSLQAQRYYLRLRHRIGVAESAGLEEFLKMGKGVGTCARIA